MSPTWINGVLDYWNIGKSLKYRRSYAFGFSITPLLQYSNTPIGVKPLSSKAYKPD